MDNVEIRILANFWRIFLSLAESLRKSHSEENLIKICKNSIFESASALIILKILKQCFYIWLQKMAIQTVQRHTCYFLLEPVMNYFLNLSLTK